MGFDCSTKPMEWELREMKTYLIKLGLKENFDFVVEDRDAIFQFLFNWQPPLEYTENYKQFIQHFHKHKSINEWHWRFHVRDFLEQIKSYRM
jgi:hypothetical protein